MKPSQTAKALANSPKTKKNVKDREKRKSSSGNNDSNHVPSTDKTTSPTKESSKVQLYAGIDSESLLNYSQQIGIDHPNEDALDLLTEDINYKLRYIINDSLIRARLQGRNAITSIDIQQTFKHLSFDRIYGCSNQPNWIPLGFQNLYCLEDQIESLVDIAEETTIGTQYTETILFKKWSPELKEIPKSLKTFYTTMCHSVIHNDEEIRRFALKTIASNCRIGPITEWFYNFSYILLSKDVTYDCLTVRALNLVTTLESSAICRLNVSEKQLKLLTRLILQRLLKSEIGVDVLKRFCHVLSLLCTRGTLEEFVILKIGQKFNDIFNKSSLALVLLITALGYEAITSLFLPNVELILQKNNPSSEYHFALLELYNLLKKTDFLNMQIYNEFMDIFSNALNIYHNPIDKTFKDESKMENNLTKIKCDFARIIRKIKRIDNCSKSLMPIECVFVMPAKDTPLYQKVTKHKEELNHKIHNSSSTSYFLIGKTSLLLPIFRSANKNNSICDLSLML